jgi:lipopolysaccharide export system protein LptA
MLKRVFVFKNTLLFLLAGQVVPAFGQEPTRIEIVNAAEMSYNKDMNGNVRKLIGNVEFKHKGARLFCDSAYQHIDQNNMDAYGHVRIVQGDTLTLTGKRLFYEDDKQLATIYDEVVMKDRKTTLTTDQMIYDMQTNVASYAHGARIVDGENILTSQFGYYYSKSHDLYFKHDVVLVNPKYEMKGDTLRYNTTNSTAYFLGPTTIHSAEDLIYCEKGWYNTETQISSFSSNAFLKTKTQVLKGDMIYYDRLKGYGRADGHVTITDSVNQVIIGGDFAEHYEKTDSSFATGHALMTQLFDGDSLFLHSDTLMAVSEKGDTSSDTKKHTLFAFHNVRIFKSDLQGSCDSLVYDYRDSTIRLFTKPVLWSGLNQLTADSITMQVAHSKIDKIFLVNSAFLASRADSLQQGLTDSLRFNQIRGKNMTGYFSDNKLYKIFVEGNGQTIYYGKNKTDQMVGVNRAECSDLMIYVNNNKVKGVTLLNKPDATFYPIRELSTRELRLKGFQWLDAKRPGKKEDIFTTD